METRTRKGNDGWESETDITLTGEDHDGVKTLRLTTSKSSRGGISTIASVIWMRPDRSFTFVYPYDFTKTVEFDKTKRCTEKTVKEFHVRSLLRIDEIKTSVAVHYAKAAA